jgi:hypothetical protein
VNAKVVLKGGRLILVATVDIKEGDEIFLDYGLEYWLDRLDKLQPEAAAEVWDRAKRAGMDLEGVKTVKVKRMTRSAFETTSSARGGKEVRKAIDRMSEIERDKYALNNVEQCEQLATDLQYLVGRQYYADENGVRYLVDSIDYEESYKAVIGYRRALDGKLHHYDYAPHLVYGDGGILQLVDLWGIDGRGADVRWPETNQEWAQRQRECEATRILIAECSISGEETKVGGDKLALDGPDGLLVRKYETKKGRVLWQK